MQCSDLKRYCQEPLSWNGNCTAGRDRLAIRAHCPVACGLCPLLDHRAIAASRGVPIQSLLPSWLWAAGISTYGTAAKLTQVVGTTAAPRLVQGKNVSFKLVQSEKDNAIRRLVGEIKWSRHHSDADGCPAPALCSQRVHPPPP